jgi:hypothetical protein
MKLIVGFLNFANEPENLQTISKEAGADGTASAVDNESKPQIVRWPPKKSEI